MIRIILFITITLITILNLNSQYYWNKEDIEAISYIKNNFSIGENVISTYPFSNFLPAIVPDHVYFGHFYQTANYKEKVGKIVDFFNNKIDRFIYK